MSDDMLARLDERIKVLRKDIDKVPDMINGSRDALAERIRYEIEQAFKLADGQREQAQRELEDRLKDHVTTQFTEFEAKLDKHLQEQLKGDWKRQLPMIMAILAITIALGFDKVWPIIRAFIFKG